MPKRMLIDASHPEETRVVVLDGTKVEEFDFESAAKKPLKGNIYLAKVTRVEPSLQAAFVEYGGNRQGFLAFSEIHPDYYQIPVADRQELIAEAEAEARHRSEEDFESFEMKPGAKAAAASDENEEKEPAEDADADAPAAEEPAEAIAPETEAEEPAEAPVGNDISVAEDSGVEFGITAPAEPEAAEDAVAAPPAEETDAEEAPTEAQALTAMRPSQRWMRRRHYKIQEVIKRRQIILVQVVKEERGNKGAALTTYLSLAGRYCVLMPNTPRGGGISRKITNAADRKRLKAAAQSLDLPDGMGLIIRTAGESRTKLEIKRDYEYLLRMWDTIREMTLHSTAPACVYEEGDLVKRAIRDLYNKDVAEVLVEGETAYHAAKDFMRMLMPSHAKNVKPYKEPVPLFQRFHIEAQLDAMFSPTVTLKSGGYIVIDQTEALVAIDVNSGRATKEHSIEETALRTNLEAADEIGRQLRLRDLAGLIVVDFIDMEESRNDRQVEKRMAAAVKTDRARIQIGKISQFGLLEFSRQRLRAGVVAASTILCPYCGGLGLVRSTESTALRTLRGIEDEAQKQRAESLVVHVAEEVAIYILNQKRAELALIESEFAIKIAFEPKEGLKAGDFVIDRIGQRAPEARVHPAVTVDSVEAEPESEEEAEAAEEPEAETPETDEAETAEQSRPEGEGRRRRRRHRGGRGRNRGERREDRPSAPQPQQMPPQTALPADAAESGETAEPAAPEESQPDDRPLSGEAEDPNGDRRKRRRRHRGRRGGRNRNGNFAGEQPSGEANGEPNAPAPAPEQPLSTPAPTLPEPSFYEDRFGRIADEVDTTPRVEPSYAPVSLIEPDADVPDTTPREAPAPKPVRPEKPAKAAPPAPPPEPEAPAAAAEAPTEPSHPARKGWWQRTFHN